MWQIWTHVFKRWIGFFAFKFYFLSLRAMEDSDDSEAKLREEIEAELDKISISSLENDEVENDSVSDTQSDSSDTVSVSP